MTAAGHRATIYLEKAEILEHRVFAAEQFILRLRAPRAALDARAGQFAHIRCAPSVALRRPLSIMSADVETGCLEFLYKPRGKGLAKLAQRQPGEILSVLAPIGRGFELEPSRPRVLAIGGGVGIPPILFLAQQQRNKPPFKPCVLVGSELPFPFELIQSKIANGEFPESATDSLALLEECGIPSRLASNSALRGCFAGFVTLLAHRWLDQLSTNSRAEVQLVACGPEPMLEASAKLAANFDLPCQLAVEEYMACAVGGCAGCTVLVQTPEGPAMKRVCIDGPVFEAREIYTTLFG